MAFELRFVDFDLDVVIPEKEAGREPVGEEGADFPPPATFAAREVEGSEEEEDPKEVVVALALADRALLALWPSTAEEEWESW